MNRMSIRYTEFLKFNDKEVNLYVIQDSNDCLFKVHIMAREKMVLSVFKNGTNWNIFPQNVPQWVADLIPLITSTIERKSIQG
jgi:hypothetical protein